MRKAGQLSLKQRYLLESLLNEGSKLCTIASALDRDPRGIAYEIKTHRQLFVRKNQRNQCGIQDKCQKCVCVISAIRVYANTVLIFIVILFVLTSVKPLIVSRFLGFLVFYCDARRSEQKGKCEKNHEHFREIIAKGRDMDHFGQKTIDRVSLHVNNYPRKSLNYHSPLSCSLPLLHKKVFELNNLYTLPTSKVTLKHLDK